MKRVFKNVFTCLVVATLFSSCSSKEGEQTIIGDWKVSKAEGGFASSYNGVSIKFDDKNMVLNGISDPYTLSSDSITTISNAVGAKTLYTFKFKDEKLMLKNHNMNLTLYCDKQ